ncbi:DUF6460 domain-containing protein [Labrys portucalensis]|jgi:hypothetical protein|uniref:DUF6460 domain-containing protein n=1 Tax=Labrys neptuniae TaxID=376174 RepID=A0ABV3PQH5_9HYPH|nr:MULTISPECIES: DUF6460 domain-containing protein [Labrys]MDT3381091.1 DUF6460 domain-containing protein [Labrys neptuniae]QEN89681.1 hypothetical protein FZC33_26670 [Labrys sp. KNU-23]
MAGLEKFMGGSVMGTIIKLVVVSVAVGLVLAWLDLTPWELLARLRHFLERLSAQGFGMIKDLFGYFLLGAVIVVPIWLVLRLLKSAPSGGRK